MSDDKKPQNPVSTDIRNDPLPAYEKKELTHYLRDLRVAPQTGKVVLHFNNGMITRVEPQFSL